jgi:DNA invertase Pin-like site-specific DNA recombinase
MTYLLYARVSPKGSTWAASESSIPVQLRACREYVLRTDPAAHFDEVTDEFESGKDTKRPGFQRVLSDLESRRGDWDALVVYSIDRLGRSIGDMLPFFESMHKAGRGLMAVRQNIDMNTAGGRAMLYLMCVFAQLEREMNSERTTAKMMSIAAGGGIPYGKAPYGYRRVEKSNILAIDLEPAANVRRVFSLYADANPLGIITAETGLPKTTVMTILRRRIYHGVIEYGGKTFPGKHEPLVSQDLWERANARLPGPTRIGMEYPNARTAPYLLSGLVKCHCGRSLTPYSVIRRGKKGVTRYHYYKCTDPRCAAATPADALDQRVLDHCREDPLTAKAIKAMVSEINRSRADRMRETTPRLQDIEAELAEARRRLKAADEAFFSGIVTAANAAHWNNAMSDAARRIDDLEKEKESIAVLSSSQAMDPNEVIERLRYWGEVIDRNDSEHARRAFLQSRVSQVVLEPDKRVRVTFVMTAEGCWLPRWDCVITIPAVA